MKLRDKLKAEGWLEQFTASGARLQEAVENYISIGFEVKTVPIMELDPEGCAECFNNETDPTKMIFTRMTTET